MRLSTLLPLLPIAAAAPAPQRAEPAPLLVPRDEAAVHPGRYIVALKDNTDASALDGVMKLFPSNATQVYQDLFTGFTAELDEASLKALRDHPDVEFVEPDQDVSPPKFEPQSQGKAFDSSGIFRRQDRLQEYMGDPNAGEGVCAYVLDTGIDCQHNEFEGRAEMVAATIDPWSDDRAGHGIHVAGILASRTYGVAKKAKLYGIKVLGDDGRAEALSTIIAGMNIVAQDAPRRNCPNGVVVNMSLGGPRAVASNMAARKLVEKGYFVAVAAGNSRQNTAFVSPASEPSVCTVGGYGYADSNWGDAVNIQGPAVNILSTVPGNRRTYMTGTSMASPFIAGLAAAMASKSGRRAGPHLCQEIVQLANARG